MQPFYLCLGYFLIFILNFIKADPDPEIFTAELSKTFKGKLERDKYRFYKIEIPSSVKINTTDLVFRVQQSEMEDFCDPDIYASIKNKYPKIPNDSEYYSERYGEDFLSIPKSVIEAGKILYFSIYCGKKCSYDFSILLEKEVKIEVGEVKIFSLKEGKSQILSFEHNSHSKKTIQFISSSQKLSPFKMFVSKNEIPSSQNTFHIFSSWMGGYYSIIENESSEWCENCTYYILLEAEKGTADITIMVKYEDTINNLKNFEPIFSTVMAEKIHCYTIEIEEKNKKENFIIETILFSGDAKLAMNPWTNPIIHPNDFYGGNVFKYEDDINAEIIRIVTPEERKVGDTGKFIL